MRKRQYLETLKENVHQLQSENQMLQQIHERHVLATCLLNLRSTGERSRSYSLEEQLLTAARQEGGDDEISFADFDPKGEFGKELNLKLALLLDDAEVDMEKATKEVPTELESPEEMRNRIRRERNRVHARRARLRKKIILQKAQQVLCRLKKKNEHLQHKLTALASETGLTPPQ